MKLRQFIPAFLLAALALSLPNALRAADDLPIFNATLTVGKEHRFILVVGSKTSAFLKVGDTFEGYAVKAYDPKAAALALEKDGKKLKVPLASDAGVANAPAGSASPVHATIED